MICRTSVFVGWVFAPGPQLHQPRRENNALMAAGKDFELVYAPNANHFLNFGSRQYVFRRMYDYRVRYLRSEIQ